MTEQPLMSTRVALAGRSRARSPLRWFARAALREPIGAVAAVVLIAILALSLCGGRLSGQSGTLVFPSHRFLAPSTTHWLGTDNLGRDVFARLAAGGVATLRVAFLSMLVASVIGAAVGVVTGYYRAWIELVLMRVVDALLGIPALLLAMVLVLALGQSERAIILAITIVQMPLVARVARAAIISVRAELYVQAAASIGAGDLRIMLRHLLPQTLNSMVVIASSMLGGAIIIDASLSFLGVGRPPTDPSWGGMLSGAGRTFLASAWWMAVFSGLAIALTVLAFNLLGDSLRLLLDPRARGRRG